MLPSVYVISDSQLTDNIAHTLQHCIDYGVPWVGIREYHMDATALNILVEQVLNYAQPFGVLVSIWGFVDIADRFGIGCHVNMHTYTPHIKPYLNWECPLGVSTHTENDICKVRNCDYITLSPVFDSISKPTYQGMGGEAFASICATAPMPVFALGGITPTTAPMAFESGAYGIAICGKAMHDPAIIKQIMDTI